MLRWVSAKSYFVSCLQHIVRNLCALLFVLISSTAATHQLGVRDGEKPSLNHHNYLWFLSEGLGVFLRSICHSPTKFLGISACQSCLVLWAHIDTSKFALNPLFGKRWHHILEISAWLPVWIQNPYQPCAQGGSDICIKTLLAMLVCSYICTTACRLHRLPWSSLSKMGLNLLWKTHFWCLGSCPVLSSGMAIKPQVLFLAV